MKSSHQANSNAVKPPSHQANGMAVANVQPCTGSHLGSVRASYLFFPSHGQGANQSGQLPMKAMTAVKAMKPKKPMPVKAMKALQAMKAMKPVQAMKAMKAMKVKAMKSMKAMKSIKAMETMPSLPKQEKPKPHSISTWRLVLPCSKAGCPSWIFYRHYLHQMCGIPWATSAIAGPKYCHPNYQYT